VFLQSLGKQDKKGETYSFGESVIDLAKLDREKDLYLGDERAEYFVCGPEPFMIAIRRHLMGWGVDKKRINLELFATGDVADE
jgi:nitric oxide dioxygenase